MQVSSHLGEPPWVRRTLRPVFTRTCVWQVTGRVLTWDRLTRGLRTRPAWRAACPGCSRAPPARAALSRESIRRPTRSSMASPAWHGASARGPVPGWGQPRHLHRRHAPMRASSSISGTSRRFHPTADRGSLPVRRALPPLRARGGCDAGSGQGSECTASPTDQGVRGGGVLVGGPERLHGRGRPAADRSGRAGRHVPPWFRPSGTQGNNPPDTLRIRSRTERVFTRKCGFLRACTGYSPGGLTQSMQARGQPRGAVCRGAWGAPTAWGGPHPDNARPAHATPGGSGRRSAGDRRRGHRDPERPSDRPAHSLPVPARPGASGALRRVGGR